MNCGRTIVQVTKVAEENPNQKHDYKKSYVSLWMGFKELSKPVTPNQIQEINKTDRFFTYKYKVPTEPVCSKNVQKVVLYMDFWDSFIHGWIGGIYSSRSLLIYCNP